MVKSGRLENSLDVMTQYEILGFCRFGLNVLVLLDITDQQIGYGSQVSLAVSSRGIVGIP